MGWNQFARDYLGFTRKERIGMLVLASLILVVFLLPDLVATGNSAEPSRADTAWIAAVRNLEEKRPGKESQRPGPPLPEQAAAYQYDQPVSHSSAPALLFDFDPNTLDEAGWKKLGLKDKIIHTIQNYLVKGGHFYKPDDLKKIYGLPPGQYYRLEPYIKIISNRAETKPAAGAKIEPGEERIPRHSIDINTADTTAFIALPGIGSRLAARIVNFRDKLGGFYAISQVGETYGLPDSTFQKIKKHLKLEGLSLKKININTATVDELKGHPYIRYAIAGALVAYRDEHGPFANIEDLRKVMIMTEETFNKISPYLLVQ